MRKEALIRVVSIQRTESGTDEVNFFTKGSYEITGDTVTLCYKESEEMGLEGNTVTLTVEDGKAVMERSGKTPSVFIIDTNNKHYCNYGTDYGSITFGVKGIAVEYAIRENGRVYIYLQYSLDANSSFVTENKMFIRITHDETADIDMEGTEKDDN